GLAILILFGMALDSRLFFEVALLIALFGFFSTVVISKYILRGDVID
ncbi:MAG: K+/H+ antiporter subunit F, partial [Pseudomonadaceae bacterium]|nr:K+/H+ antiporter subunit F [Pseudomonadaceae bacterium]